MDQAIAATVQLFRWFLEQPLVLQLLLGLGALSVLYFLVTMLRVLLVGLFAAFRGL